MGTESLALLGRMPGVRVLCLGDIMLDRYIHGEASRISPEAPVPVVHVKKMTHIPGGVGNVVRNLSAWGIVPLVVSVVGDDDNARALASYLPGGETKLTLLPDVMRPTTVKTRVIAGIQQVVRFDEEIPLPLSDAMSDRVIAAVKANLPGVAAVAVSDYGKGVVNPRVMRSVIGLAAEQGIPVAIDPKGFDYAKYAGADLVKPNRKELGEAVGGSVDAHASVVRAGRELMQRHGIKNLLVTLSDKGMLLFRGGDGGARPVELPSRAREVFDVTGAGDTVLAGMSAALAVGAPLELGARLATLAAGVVVAKLGTAVALPEELERAAREEE